VARVIHHEGPRRHQIFQEINCADLSETLIESELFGHERGSFTGAHAKKVGLFELADRGTVFLDEIGEMSLDAQKKLLNFLSEGEFRPIGGRLKRVDVRTVCATSRDLKAEVEARRFNEALYYRIEGFKVVIPALRERREDIPALAIGVLSRSREAHRRRVSCISTEAMSLLQRHPFPGNVRQLENAIEKAVLYCEDAELQPRHFAEDIRAPQSKPGHQGPVESLRQAKRDFERRLIENALTKSKNDAEAAELLGVSARWLYKLKKAYGLRD
jgi:DNA-binding NtrC family response regulator